MRLGDLDTLKTILFNDTQYGFWHDSMDGSDIAYTQRELFGCIDAMPTIDAVPVVRCANCIHYGEEASAFDAWTPFCLKHKLTTFPDDFCSYGERKDGEG